MKKIKSTATHTIYEKRSGRHAVKDRRKRWVLGDDKVAVLKAEGLMKTPEPKAKPAEPEPTAEAESDAETAG
ncbi:MAG: hypothetical protein GVY22_12250 [Gammaproteobacteria bacterium]|jgi:hypothetical protein|nr:hypothetical protein [Gammaproteobacteria bacterium]